MELNEKKLIEKTKSIDMPNLFTKGTYIDIYIQKTWRQAYIIDTKPNNKYDIIYLTDQIKRKNDMSYSSLGIMGEHSSSVEYLTRNRCLDNNIYHMEYDGIMDLLKERISDFNIDLEGYKIIKIENDKEKNEDENDAYIGYNMYQFLSGTFIDCLAYIYNELDDSEKSNNTFDDIIVICLDIILFVLETIKNNLSLIKIFLNNTKLLILDNTYAILASFRLILGNINFIFCENFSENEKISQKKSQILQKMNELIINNTKKFDIPLPILVKLIEFITMNKTTKASISNYKHQEIFDVYLKCIQNLKESEIKNIKKINVVKEYTRNVVKGLYDENKKELVEECYYTAILICLKCNILEKKFAALNCINEVIDDEKYNKYFYDFFIEKNKILELFFDENIHDEVIKRSNDLFKYLAKHDKLNEDIINKLIKEEDDRDIYKNIIIDIISELPLDKKNYLFNEITKKLNFGSNQNDIDYLIKLVEACLKPSKKETKKEEKEKEEEDDLYEKRYNIGINGLNLLFNYIIKDFDINKPYDKNNVDEAIESFSKAKYLKPNDILNYIDKLFENIKTDESHKSVIQCMILIVNLINQINEKIEYNIFQKLDSKYHILNLIVNDLMRYINIIINKKETLDQKKIFEGIYPFDKNIEQRFVIFFFFVKGTNNNEGLKLDSKKHLEKIYCILNHELFKDELNKFFFKFTLNIKYIDVETLNDFLTNVIENKDLFDIENFTNQKIYLFINKTILNINKEEGILFFDSKNTRVKKEDIKKIDLLFEILINNKSSDIQNKIFL